MYSSLSYTVQFISAPENLCDMYALGFQPSSVLTQRVAPVANFEASASTHKGLLGSTYVKVGSLTNSSFNISNAVCCLSPHLNTASFFVNSVRGLAISANLGMNGR